MIVRFAITPRSLSLDAIPASRRPRVLKRIVNSWGKMGRLVVLNGDQGVKELLEEIGRLPLSLRKDWQEALKRFRFQMVPDLLPVTLESGSAQILDLREVIEVLGHALKEFERDKEDLSEVAPEVVLTSEILESEAFALAEERIDRNIAEGEKVREVWQARARPLAEFARRITVVDRYCLERFRPEDEYFHSCGLKRFLQFLAVAESRMVVVYGAFDETSPGADFRRLEISEALNGVSSTWGPKRPRVEVKVVPQSHFRKQHDRFIVFDYQVWEIGSGLEVFQGTRTWRNSTSTLKRKTHQHQETIKFLDAKARYGFTVTNMD